MKRVYEGSITIFLAIIFMAFVFFTGTIVDVVRIALAEQRFENALEASARSILANYNKDLVGEFGIMGLDTEADKENLKNDLDRYLRVNLMETHKGIKLVNCTVDTGTLNIKGIGSLANQDILKHQILEYMKYKAPILITENIITKLKEAKLDKAVDFAENAKEVRVKEKQIREKVNSLNSKINNVSKKIMEKATEELEEIYKELADIKSLSDTLHEDKEGVLEGYINTENKLKATAEQNNFKAEASLELKDLVSEARQLSEKTEKIMKRIEADINAVKSIRNTIKQLETEKNSIEAKIIQLNKELLGVKDLAAPNIVDLRQQLEKYHSEKEQIEAEISKHQTQIDNLMSSLRNEIITQGFGVLKLEEDSQTAPEHGKDQEAGLKERIELIKQKLLLKTISKDSLISLEEFNNTVREDKAELSDMYKTTGVLKKLEEHEGEKNNDNIIAFLKQLVAAINLEAEEARNKLYMIEYIMDKFTFLTSNTVRNHYFTKGEVEYILSGKDIPYDAVGNTELSVIISTISKLWFMRFAIDFIDIFVHSHIPHPLTRLIWALVEGSIDASVDMLRLLNGDSVNISPSISNIKLRYSDHLRILLLMQSEKETLRKVQQLMQVNIKSIISNDEAAIAFKLASCNTTINVEAEAGVNLWFLPMLNIDKLGYKQIRNGHYIMKKSIYIGY